MSDKNEVLSAQQQSWDKFSNGWKKWEGFIQSWMGLVGEKLIETAQIKDGDKVIDAATGTGEPGVTVAERFSGSEVTGTDVSDGMVGLANETAKERGVSNYKAVTAPTSELPFEDNSFDSAVSRFGVIFAPDVSADIVELKRVVKEGGYISASAWNGPDKNPWATIIPKIIGSKMEMPAPNPDAPGLFRCAAPDSLASIMSEAGLSDVESTEVSGEMTVESPEQFWQIMIEIAAPIVGALSKASDEIKEEVKKETIETLNENHMRDGKVVFPWSAWVVSGKK